LGVSVTMSEIIILIAATILASGFSAYAVYYGNLLQNNVAQAVDSARYQFNMRVRIAYATVEMGEEAAHFVVYAKNTGHLPISSFDSIDLYLGAYGRAELYRYSSTPDLGYFTLSDSDGDQVWEIGETGVLTVYNQTGIDAALYEARIYLFRGVGDTYLFTPNP